MKFAQYLDNTQIPEWKKAYIDFKGLKKRIGGIRKAGQGGKFGRQSTRFHRGAASITPDPVSVKSSSLGRPDEETLSRTQLASASEKGERSSFPNFLAAASRRRSLRRSSQHEATVDTPLGPLESSFFACLDHELEKVDRFYNDHEDTAVEKLGVLRNQLRELQEHRQLFHKSEATPNESWKRFFRKFYMTRGSSGAHVPGSKDAMTRADPGGSERVDEDSSETARSRPSDRLSSEPHEYLHAKRKMRKALQEFYRSLELLNDYRVLNLTGFRKVLKKYDKVTGRSFQDSYMNEKVLPRRFAFSEKMREIMQEMENTYAARFDRGDLKKARRRLRASHMHKSHHFGVFRSGILIGTAIPAVASGLYKSLQPETGTLIPERHALLVIYSVLLVPVLLSLLIGVNMITWTRAHINFPFIFELDVGNTSDFRKYFELPALLFSTLSYAFWLSFFAIGSKTIAPTTWPAIWIAFTLIMLISPFPILSRQSRYWLLNRFLRLLVPGTTRVDFADFWMGDQLCSLTYTMANLFTLVCAYSHGWHNVFGQCTSTQHWFVPYILLAFPYLVRMLQSIRRYYDARLVAHLVNGGKYFSSIVANLVYFIWKARGSPYNYVFVIWCLLATLNSIYLASWDVLMDWSLLSTRRSDLTLRKELLYTSNPFVYYFAIITNTVIRFIWVIYVPSKGLNRNIRAFIVAVLEVGRRIQWNSYRLENEQIGNADQYRATREVPLPYSGQPDDDHDESDIEGDEQPSDTSANA